MISVRDKESLRQEFMVKAESIFERALEQGDKEKLTLSQMEELVGQLKFELTSCLVESLIEVQARQMAGPGPSCKQCGREMRHKGEKQRQVVTSQGKIEVERPYYYCDRCRQGFFPPGPTIRAGSAGLE